MLCSQLQQWCILHLLHSNSGWGSWVFISTTHCSCWVQWLSFIHWGGTNQWKQWIERWKGKLQTHGHIITKHWVKITCWIGLAVFVIFLVTLRSAWFLSSSCALPSSSISFFLRLILNYLCHSPPTFPVCLPSSFSFCLSLISFLHSPLHFLPTPSLSVSLLSSSVSLTLSDQGRSRELHRSEEEIILHIKACKGG